MWESLSLAAKVRASLGVKDLNSTSSCMTYEAMAPKLGPRRSIQSFTRTFPLTLAPPPVEIRSLRMFNREVLPAPEAPMMYRTSPGRAKPLASLMILYVIWLYPVSSASCLEHLIFTSYMMFENVSFTIVSIEEFIIISTYLSASLGLDL